MGVKKIARPLNNAKNKFVEWLKYKNANSIDIYEGEKSSDWYYYRCVSAFIGNNLYTVYFMCWNGEVKIDYSDSENTYTGISINEFLELIP